MRTLKMTMPLAFAASMALVPTAFAQTTTAPSATSATMAPGTSAGSMGRSSSEMRSDAVKGGHNSPNAVENQNASGQGSGPHGGTPNGN